MNLLFQGWRRGHYKVTGGVIDEAILRGHRVTLIHGKAGKAGEGVTTDELHARWPKADILSGHGNTLHAHAIIGDPSVGDACSFGAPPTVPVYALDFIWEQRMRPRVPGVTRCWATERHQSQFAWLNAASPWGNDCHLYSRVDSTVTDPVIGMPALDAIPLVDPAAVRKKYHLGTKPIVLLFSLKLGVPHLWRKTVFKYWWYPEMLYAIKDYCQKRGALLVVKTRVKHADSSIVHAVADRVITDEALWPYTSAELVRVADLAIHFQSGAVFEAAAAGIPQLSIRVPQPHLEHFPGHAVFFSHEPHTLQHWPGVVQSIDYREAARLLRDFPPEWKIYEWERQRYLDRYTGPIGTSSSRVLDLIESRA